ncbi:MAG: hypothetical protein P8J32_02525 [bacterium]|nr:hypothetical protein [bacterium]
MSDTASQTNTALVHAPTGAAISAIVQNVVVILARMLPAYQRGKGRGRNRIHLSDRIEAVEGQVIMDPTQANIPLVVELSFRPERRLKGAKIIQRQGKDGVFLFNEDGTPNLGSVRDERVNIQSQVTLPGERHHREVRLARVTTGDRKSGGLVPAIIPDTINGGWRGGPSLPCMLFWEIDPKTMRRKRNARLLAMPLGLATLELLDRWNRIVAQKLAHKQDGTWFQIAHIPNKIGGDERIEFTPKGAYQMLGLTCTFDDKNRVEINKEDPHKSGDLQIVGLFGGKFAFLSRRSIPIVFKREGNRMVPATNVFRVTEHFGHLEFSVVGLAEEVTEARGMLIHSGEQTVSEALALIGGDLKTTKPRSVARLFNALISSPPREAMQRRGLIDESSSQQAVVANWCGLQAMVVSAAKQELTQAKEDIVHALSIGNASGCPSLEEVCGGEITPQRLRNIHDGHWGEEENLFATWMLYQDVAASLGFTQWEPNSWVLTSAFRELFQQRVNASDHEMAPRSATPATQGPSGEGKKKDKKKGGHRRRQRRTGSTDPAST